MEVATAASFTDFGGIGLLKLEIVEARLTGAAADGLQVKARVFLDFTIEDPEQVAAKLFASRAAQAMAAPDVANGVHSAATTIDDGSELRGQILVGAEGLLDCGHFLRGQRFVEEGFEFGLGEIAGHVFALLF